MFQNLKKDQKNKGLKKINSKRKGVKNSLSFVFLLIFSIIFSCSFVDIVKADVLNSYSKVLGDTLTATEWNNLNSDFLKSYTSDTMEGVLNILLTGGSNAELKIQSIGGENQHWGIYHDRGTEDLRFWNNNITGEKNLLTLTNDGKVGVGTTTPAYTLDVEGTINADNLYIGGTPFSGGLWSAVGADIYYNSGNVGIGTTTPSEVLDVVGKISINNGGNSVFLGEGAGFSDIAGSFSYSNIGIGYQALYNSQGHDNSANGYRALYTNVWGSHNTANGSNSLYFNTDNYNTANGSNSLYSNTTGSHNTASGYNSLSSNTTGRYNIAIGSYSGMLTVNGGEGDSYYRTGDGGVFLGYNTKPLNDGDQNEIVIGYNTTGLGSNSVVLGNNDITKTILKGSVGIGTTNPNVSVGLDVQEGTGHSILAGNLKIGNVATPEATTDAVNKAYVDDNFIPSAGGTGGAGAGFVQGGNTFGTAAVLGTNDNYGLSFETNGSVKMNISPTGNVGIGIGTVFASNSLEVNGRLKLYNGVQGKIFIGNMAGEGNLSTGTGDYNIAIGDYALHDNSDGDRNIAIGSQSLYSNTASRNIAIGADSLQINYTGASNTAIGVQSLTSNWSGLHNIAIGDNALGGNSSGSYNIALGNYAGQSIISGANNQTGNYNLFLGYDTRPLADGDQNEIVIGYNATGIGSNSVVLGNDSITKT
ncbi:MAG: hypothetical protein EOL97_12440, partial [Spirochaetia bacterium]|nr:hypothetical protein [Spirochaetia bacterium]